MARSWSLKSVGFPLFVVSVYLFLYVPILVLIIFSFNNAPFPSPWMGFTTSWYHELFNSSILWTAFFNSIIIALCATVLSLLLSLGLVYYASSGHALGKQIYLFFGSVFIPEVVLAIGLLSFLSFAAIPLGLVSLIAGHTVLGFGYAVPLIYASYKSLDKRLIEASLDLGATKTKTFFTVIVPLLRPALLIAALTVFILSFDDFIISYFCAGGEAQTLSLYIYSMLRSGISPLINALSTLLIVLSSILVFVFCSVALRSKQW